MNKHKEIKIESSLDEMFRVEQFVEEISDEYLLYGNYFGNILMAVSEAVKNAIIHGNRLDTAEACQDYRRRAQRKAYGSGCLMKVKGLIISIFT